MTPLINPANNQPCEFVASQCGYIALRLTCTVTPAIQWFSQAAIEAANPVHTCEHDPRLTGMIYDQPQPAPEPLTFTVLPEMVGTISHALGVTLVYPPPPDDAYVVKPAPITVYHDAMRPAA